MNCASCGHAESEHRPAWVSEAPNRCTADGWNCPCKRYVRPKEAR